jgi:hypothetical protein
MITKPISDLHYYTYIFSQSLSLMKTIIISNIYLWITMCISLWITVDNSLFLWGIKDNPKAP